MKEIGGYFELELNSFKEYHQDAIKLNSGRSALLYILKVIKPEKIFIPYYICNSVLEPINKLKIEFEFYHINNKFEPILPPNFRENDFILYVNYFGINDHITKRLVKKNRNIITDNSQAFFCPPYKSPTFYSPRKFFGVADGGYLYIDKILEEDIPQAISFKNSIFLLKSMDLGTNAGYEEYKNVEDIFSHQPLEKMSKLTQKILSSIDYDRVKTVREDNFFYLHKHLNNLNELEIDTKFIQGPLKYPLLIKKNGIKQLLIKNKIYISTYWQEVFERVKKNTFEYELTKFLLPLPIDQRYNRNDMDTIIGKINEALKH